MDPIPQASIDLRGGWSQTGVKDIYHCWSAKGDNLVGRMLTGLPRQHRDFMTLPPHFRQEYSVPADQILEYIRVVFGNLPQTFLGVAKYALASLVYHSEWLRDHLPENHSLFKTGLFRNTNLLAAVKSSVVCILPNASYPLQASGVPNDVYIREEIFQLPQRIEAILDARDLASGQLTASAFNDRMTVFAENMNNQLNETMRGMRALYSPIDQQDLSLQEQGQETDPIHGTIAQAPMDHGDFISQFNMVPRNYTLPTKVGLKNIWSYWWQGDRSKNIMRFRKLDGRAFGNRNTPGNPAQRFSDLKYLMNKLEEKLSEVHYDLSTITNHRAVTDSFELAYGRLSEDYVDWFSKTNRVDQLQWGSFCKPLRKIDKERRREAANAGTRDDTTDSDIHDE